MRNLNEQVYVLDINIFDVYKTDFQTYLTDAGSYCSDGKYIVEKIESDEFWLSFKWNKTVKSNGMESQIDFISKYEKEEDAIQQMYSLLAEDVANTFGKDDGIGIECFDNSDDLLSRIEEDETLHKLKDQVKKLATSKKPEIQPTAHVGFGSMM